MANKRMFSLSVVDTDLFLEMPLTSRLLYYELGMRADDDGFVDNWKKLLKMTGLTEDDMKVLIAKEFVIPFESGVIVIKHWRLNNYLRNDRHQPTRHKAELAQLYINDDVYELESTEKSTMLPDGIPSGRQVVYPDKNSIDKNSIDKKYKRPSLEEIQDYIKEKGLRVDGKKFFDYFETGNWIDSKGNKVKNWKQKLLTWNSHIKEEVSNRFYDPNDQYSDISDLFVN